VDGNFCWGQHLPPVEACDPVAVHRAVQDELRSGRVLTMMALRQLRVALSGTRGLATPYPSWIRRAPRPALTLSSQGRGGEVLADLPWAAPPGERVNRTVPTRTAPEGVTLTTSELAGVLHIEATFHRSTYPPELVARALSLLSTDPTGLLPPATPMPPTTPASMALAVR
jgi:hypothetical protein